MADEQTVDYEALMPAIVRATDACNDAIQREMLAQQKAGNMSGELAESLVGSVISSIVATTASGFRDASPQDRLEFAQNVMDSAKVSLSEQYAGAPGEVVNVTH